jgi:hypothetical protein
MPHDEDDADEEADEADEIDADAEKTILLLFSFGSILRIGISIEGDDVDGNVLVFEPKRTTFFRLDKISFSMRMLLS